MSAIISECGHYRYRLDREIYPFKPAVAVIMVNPSTADATTNDATIRKLLGFGERRGWGRLIVGNLFAWRSKDVHDLANAADPIGPENDAHLRQIFLEADCVIAAWGPSAKVHKPQRSRWREVLRGPGEVLAYGPGIYRLGEPTATGEPRHPLMTPYNADLALWDYRAVRS